MKVLLVDDNIKQISLLKKLLEQNPYIDTVQYETNPLKALEYLKNDNFDVVFLDVEMPELSGLELSQTIKGKKPLIIFTTAFSHYAVSAFDVNAIDYLVKPYSRERLFFAVKKARERLIEINNTNKNDKQKVLVYDKDSMVIVNVNDILFAEHLSRVTYVVTAGKRYRYKGTLESLHEKLKTVLTKCHKGYLVNIKKANKITPFKNRTYNLSFAETDYKIPVSRTYIKTIMELFQKRGGVKCDY